MNNKGVSLLELMAVLAILVLLSGLALPQFHLMQSKSLMRYRVSLLQQTLFSARQNAILTGYSIVVCPSHNLKNCSSNWQDPIVVFMDKNNDMQINDQELLLMLPPLNPEKEKLQFNGKAIAFNARGMSDLNNGTLHYCVYSAHSEQVKIIVSRVGRIRLEHWHHSTC